MSGQGNSTGRSGIFTRPHAQGSRNAVFVVAAATAIASFGAGVVHMSAAADHENLPVMMVGFLVVGTLQVALGGLLLRRVPSRLLVSLALAMTLGSVGIWLMSRTMGLPFLPGGHMEPIGFKDGVCVLFELAAVPGLLLLGSRDLGRVSLPSQRLVSQVLGIAGSSAFMLLVPALMLDGGTHHSHAEAVEMGIHERDHVAGEDNEHADEQGHDGEEHEHAAGEEQGSGASHEHGDEHSHGEQQVADAGHDHGDAGIHAHSGTSTPAALNSHHEHADADGHVHNRAHEHGGHEHGSEEPAEQPAGDGDANDHPEEGDDDGSGSGDDTPWKDVPSFCAIAPGGTNICVP